MFTGRPRRAVNLGSKKQASTHDVLRNAELQRQKREQLRRETNAVLTIQGRWRASKILSSARTSYASTFLDEADVSFESPEQFAWILPAFPQLKPDQQHKLIEKFVNSPSSHQYSPFLMSRLPIVWSLDDPDLKAYAVRVLQNQDPPVLPSNLIKALLEGDLTAQDLEFLISRDPKSFLIALLQFNRIEYVRRIPQNSLPLLYSVSEIPTATNLSGEAMRELLLRILPDASRAWRLIFTLVMAIYTLGLTSLITFTPEFCDRGLFSKSLAEVPVATARYSMALLNLFPRSKPVILLQLSLSSSPSPLSVFWKLFRQDSNLDEESRQDLLYISTEMYSYWLLVATDAELVGNSLFGLGLEDLWDFAVTIRDRSFDVLWRYMPNQRVKISGAAASTLKVLRQLYTRDSRMHLFPPNFWLMDAIPQHQFIQNIENSNTNFGVSDGRRNMKGDVDEDGDDDSDDNDDYEAAADSNKHDKLTSLLNSDERLRKTKITLNPSPSVRILEHAPFFVPFEARVALFYRFIEKDRASHPDSPYVRHHFDINRETLVEDAQRVFAALGSHVKTDLHVRMFSNGVPEAGVDGGGLTRELLMLICEDVFHKPLRRPTRSTRLVPFIETANHTLAPNPIYGENPKIMTPKMNAFYLFVGQVIGKCLYENLLVDVEFAPFFLSKWNKHTSNGYTIKSSFDDLSLLDNELYKNISKLHNMHGSQVDDLGLDFTILNSQHETVELKPNGASIPVTDSNKLEYMRELANYKLNVALRPQTSWFLMGLSQVIRLDWLSMFNPSEINKLISGESHDFDVEDLKRNTELFGFDEDSPTINNLWTVLAEFDPKQRADFLKFITSVPKAPLLGFSRLEPRLGIRCAGKDDQRLPTSSTCVNLLKLPEYTSLKTLREKLLYSIESKAGFELS